MTIDRSTLVFFDASCLIAATGSPNGGSGFLLSLCARGFLMGAVSHVVLLEAEQNIAAKMGPLAVERYHQLLMDTPLTLAPLPTIAPTEAWLQHVNAKDAHVIPPRTLGPLLPDGSGLVIVPAQRQLRNRLPAVILNPPHPHKRLHALLPLR